MNSLYGEFDLTHNCLLCILSGTPKIVKPEKLVENEVPFITIFSK